MTPIGPNGRSSSRDSWEDHENPSPAAAAAAAASPRTPEALSKEMSASPTLLDKFDAEAGNANAAIQSADGALAKDAAVDSGVKKAAGGAGNQKRRFVVVAGLILLAGAGVAVGLTLGRGGGGSSNLSTSGSMSAGNAAAGEIAGSADGAANENVGGDEESADKDATQKDEVEETPSRPPPNVVFIVLDDLGYADVSFTQPEGEGLAEVKMPNTDKLAKEGVIFTNGYSSGEVCAPTRAGFMLGRYQQGVGVYSAKSGGGDGMKILEYNSATAQYDSVNPWIPHFLKQKTSGAEADVNYVTGAFGKVCVELFMNSCRVSISAMSLLLLFFPSLLFVRSYLFRLLFIYHPVASRNRRCLHDRCRRHLSLSREHSESRKYRLCKQTQGRWKPLFLSHQWPNDQHKYVYSRARWNPRCVQ